MKNKKETYGEKRERVMNAVEFKTVDRLPVQGWNGTKAAIARITGRDDYLSHPKEVFTEALKISNIDMLLQFVLPDRLDRICGPGAELNLSGLNTAVFKILQDWADKHGKMKTPEDFRDFCLTVPSADKAKDFVSADKTENTWLALDKWGEFLSPIVWVPGHRCGKVSWMWYTSSSVGYENYLMAHILYPEIVKKLFAFLGEEARLINAAIARTIKKHGLIPLIYWGEDICDNSGPLCSPSILRNVYFPHLKRAIEPIAEAGIHLLWHSDGNILPIMPELIDCGIDGFQGFEEDKGMDMLKLSETRCRNNRLPFLCGSINVTTTMYTTPEKIREDIGRMVSLSEKRHGGVIISTSSTIMENTPVENVLAFYRYAVQTKPDYSKRKGE
ncbi:MAG: hypothetical protein JW957_05475 [Candidatus Omnitrophica bacterium]|nr:hypothetical protein [Candidatus Omnitrophota bacterium]